MAKWSVGITRRIHFAVSVLIVASFAGATATSIYKQQWLVALIGLLGLLLTFLPAFFKWKFRLLLPVELEMPFILFIFGSLFLGEYKRYYASFWWWDIPMHGVAGIALGFLGFVLMYTLLSKGIVRASPFLIAMFSFSFSLALGAIWEIFEFSMDYTFGFNMTKSGLVDTVGDLIIDSLGALTVAAYGYIYVKYRRQNTLANVLNKLVTNNPHFFRRLKPY